MEPKNIKIVFWGTPEFALPSLEALIKNGYSVAAVITNPDEPIGRSQIITPPPAKVLAQKHKIHVFQPEKLNAETFRNELPEADLFIVAAYGKIIPKDILEIPRYGALNIHPSLLPRWRGPSPIQYTILHGDKETGVTIIKIDELMDHGPIVANYKLLASLKLRRSGQVTNYKITCRELQNKLAEIGAELLIETVPKWIRGEITPMPQDDSQATYSKILKKDDGRINWSRPAEEIERMIRAFNPWPGTWTIWPSREKISRLRIEEAETAQDEAPAGTPGFVWQTGQKLFVKTGHQNLEIKKLTLEGKKSLVVQDFLRGHPEIAGEVLI
ncbi:MAG: methionyl-tRNA formyltransferase [Candidatus Sungiibacteriota bacterium]|uniref:Methionyl-tRNA formyltransferase n=1 Tax=Candidatus Sungiibacteriota bacterium TaxID=2750080 RepID=A0A7T5RJH7_9BACT|nr:MAG: methionyl-tRNA formyltransferase [Candidatus Sungbacteria bacterium]